MWFHVIGHGHGRIRMQANASKLPIGTMSETKLINITLRRLHILKEITARSQI